MIIQFVSYHMQPQYKDIYAYLNIMMQKYKDAENMQILYEWKSFELAKFSGGILTFN